MGDDDKRKFEPGATMQIDLDQVQLVDLEAGAKSRKTPPPLPASMPPLPAIEAPTSTAPAVTSVAPSSRAPAPAAPSAANNAMHIGIIVVVVAAAIGAGLAVARGLRGSPAAAASAAPSASAAPVKSSEPAGGVLEIPPIEVK
jgi:hypothetical protein